MGIQNNYDISKETAALFLIFLFAYVGHIAASVLD